MPLVDNGKLGQHNESFGDVVEVVTTVAVHVELRTIQCCSTAKRLVW